MAKEAMVIVLDVGSSMGGVFSEEYERFNSALVSPHEPCHSPSIRKRSLSFRLPSCLPAMQRDDQLGQGEEGHQPDGAAEDPLHEARRAGPRPRRHEGDRQRTQHRNRGTLRARFANPQGAAVCCWGFHNLCQRVFSCSPALARHPTPPYPTTNLFAGRGLFARDDQARHRAARPQDARGDRRAAGRAPRAGRHHRRARRRHGAHHHARRGACPNLRLLLFVSSSLSSTCL